MGNKKIVGMFAGIIVVMMFCATVGATPLPAVFDGSWTEFTDIGAMGHVEDQDGAYGGQPYDHEHLFYKYNYATKVLSIGIQSGFDLVTGAQTDSYGIGTWHLGDLALSFDGSVDLINGTGFEHAVDFGLYTENYSGAMVDAGTGTGIDAAGLYKDVVWNSDLQNDFHLGDTAAPFAMDDGSIAGALSQNVSGSGMVDGRLSYYRYVTFDVTDLVGPDEDLMISAHLTMECGNDVMNGDVIVNPEPSTIALLGIGLAGVAGGAVRRRMKSKKEEK